jgi:hypothetical protein
MKCIWQLECNSRHMLFLLKNSFEVSFWLMSKKLKTILKFTFWWNIFDSFLLRPGETIHNHHNYHINAYFQPRWIFKLKKKTKIQDKSFEKAEHEGEVILHRFFILKACIFLLIIKTDYSTIFCKHGLNIRLGKYDTSDSIKHHILRNGSKVWQ